MPTNQQRREAAKRKLERQQEKRVQRTERRKKVAAITAVVVVVAVVGATVALSTIGTGSSSPTDPSAAGASAAPSTPAATPELEIPSQLAATVTRPTPFPATVACNYLPDGKASKPVQAPATAAIPAQGAASAALDTSAGQIDIQLDRTLAPCAVNSFLSLARQGFYDGTPCHRLTTDPGLQVLQCGDPTGTGSGGPGYKFADETFPGLVYGRGQIAMANAGPNTNGSQFFMIYGDASALSPDYTLFGTLSPASLPRLDGIARAGHDGSLDPRPGGGKPRTQVTIDSLVLG